MVRCDGAERDDWCQHCRTKCQEQERVASANCYRRRETPASIGSSTISASQARVGEDGVLNGNGDRLPSVLRARLPNRLPSVPQTDGLMLGSHPVASQSDRTPGRLTGGAKPATGVHFQASCCRKEEGGTRRPPRCWARYHLCFCLGIVLSCSTFHTNCPHPTSR